MANVAIDGEIRAQVGRLSLEQKSKVLFFAQSLSKSKGQAGKELIRFGGTINPEDLGTMTEVIREGCGQGR